jgi:proteasome lid subunit RPN8/RPN11
MKSLSFTKEQYQKMIAHVNSNLPFEACGLLAGRESTVKTVLEVKNLAQSPLRYVMDPVEQLNAFEWIDSNGMDLIGIFHSHPSGPETISPTDIAESAYSVVQVILSRRKTQWRVRGFWIENGIYNEVTLRVA